MTPEPWSTGGTFNPDSDDPRQYIWGPTPPGMQSGDIVAKDVTPENARMICSVHDLLAACEAAKSLLDEMVPGDEADFDDSDRPVWRQLTAAIEKAKGKRNTMTSREAYDELRQILKAGLGVHFTRVAYTSVADHQTNFSPGNDQSFYANVEVREVPGEHKAYDQRNFNSAGYESFDTLIAAFESIELPRLKAKMELPADDIEAVCAEFAEMA